MVFIESLTQAATGAAKRKRGRGESSGTSRANKKRIIRHYCTQCGKANHAAKQCHSEEKPAARLSPKLQALQKPATDGKIATDSVCKALGVKENPRSLFALLAATAEAENGDRERAELPEESGKEFAILEYFTQDYS